MMTSLSNVRRWDWLVDRNGRYQVNVQFNDHAANAYSVGVDVDIWQALRIAFRIRNGSDFTEQQKQELIDMAGALKKDGTPRKPRGSGKASAAQVAEIVSQFANQLRFVSCAYDDSPTAREYGKHCVLNDRTLVAFNGVLAAGIRIEEDIRAAPHVGMLRKAIERAGTTFAMTVENGRLTVKSGKLRVSIPTLPIEQMSLIQPDLCQWPLGNEIRDALKAASAFANDNAPTVIVASVLLTNGTVAGTDRKVILEYYHGHSMPEVCVPKEFATAIVKCDKDIIGFGYTPDTSITFWFSDQSFIKTQLFTPGWPDSWRNALPTTLEKTMTLPDVFWQAYDAIADFSDDERIRFRNEIAHTHRSPNEGATFEMKDVSLDWTINIRSLKMVRPYISQIGEFIRGQTLGFFGDKVRGAIALSVEDEAPAEVPETPSPDPAQQWDFQPQPAGLADAYAEVQPVYTPEPQPVGSFGGNTLMSDGTVIDTPTHIPSTGWGTT